MCSVLQKDTSLFTNGFGSWWKTMCSQLSYNKAVLTIIFWTFKEVVWKHTRPADVSNLKLRAATKTFDAPFLFLPLYHHGNWERRSTSQRLKGRSPKWQDDHERRVKSRTVVLTLLWNQATCMRPNALCIYIKSWWFAKKPKNTLQSDSKYPQWLCGEKDWYPFGPVRYWLCVQTDNQ